jgi:hypothetical protein
MFPDPLKPSPAFEGALGIGVRNIRESKDRDP